MKLGPDRLLAILQHMICASVRADAPDLSARQLGILLIIELQSGPHTVRGLAGALNISKPGVSRSLDRLSNLGLAERIADPRDGRSVLVVATQAGQEHVADLQALLMEGATPGRASRAMHSSRMARETAPQIAAE